MLQIENGIQIPTDMYYIQHRQDGQDELHFEIGIHDPVYAALSEECRILESTEHQTYVVKSISGGKKSSKIGCLLDLVDWQGNLIVEYNETDSAGNILRAQMPDGWSVVDEAAKTDTKTLEKKGATPLDIVLQLQKTFDCAIRFNTLTKTATLLWLKDMPLSNTYVIDTVNLRQPPEYKGSSGDIYTRLYPYGKNGLSIASVNDGVPYIDCTEYTGQIICKYWSDNSITSEQELLSRATEKIEKEAKPEQSWKLPVVDLYRLNPSRWPDMGLELFKVVKLIDNCKGTSANVQVCEDKVYPYYPDKNEITVSTVMKSVQRSLRALLRAAERGGIL